MIIFGGRHLRYVINQYVEHYHTERNHQGIGNQLIKGTDEGANECVDNTGPVWVRTRVGGMLKYYHRAAA
jgi:hypothetical protein